MAMVTSHDKSHQADFRTRLAMIRQSNLNHMSRTRSRIEKVARDTYIKGEASAAKTAERKRKKKQFAGAYVADPRRQVPSGFSLAGILLPHVHDHVIDMDLTSLYPSIMVLMNMSPDTFVGKVVFPNPPEIPMYDYIHFIDRGDRMDYKCVPTDFFAECYVGKHWWAIFELFFNMRGIDEILTFIGNNIEQFQ